ncbi:MAG: LLM class flavin-dependent oxidoreductase [Chelatococcus sp.]|uniref:LLM class flavin-dependent oxidoreductase n=1 Tax=Chelatococcus sp. TaxID=1953771 RepID=UPI0025C139A2|nr:LLM class flavin-dependent oxidoreductase [Chelatococcus sp.]MBX3537458.1 LLM class flavin-dependent oxidoreductase [Chelatococcus sp.]
MAKTNQMKLGLLLNSIGFHIAAWRHPDARPDLASTFAPYADIAKTAERGLFDLVFLADSAAVHHAHDFDIMTKMAPFYQMEPTTLLSSLAAVTDKIGLVASITTTYNEPFHIARKMATLDHLSAGRAGWNLITSANQAEAFNFSRDAHVDHAQRYERAEEVAKIVRGLWDSWEDDAFLYDKETGQFFQREKLHLLDHKGPLFSVRGPLNVNRPPQGQPVIAQAGSSEPGKELAAETADIVFTQQLTLENGKEFYADLKGRMGKFSRERDEIKIMPGVVPFVGRTQEEADENFQKMQSLILPEVGLALLRELLGGVDLSQYPLDGPMPDLTETNAGKGRLKNLTELAKRENMSIRQLYQHAAGSRGHWVLRGTPAHIADVLEHWIKEEAADGFVVIPPYLPGTINSFVDLVVPELQRRGIYRNAYEGNTLRDHLGLARPRNKFAKA